MSAQSNRSIREWQAIVHERNISKGFYDYEKDLVVLEDVSSPTKNPKLVFPYACEALARVLADYKKALIERKLFLVVGELCEAHEELRAGHATTEVYMKGDSPKPEGFGIEMADAAIRLMDVAAAAGNDLECDIETKHDFNGTRPYKHGKVF